MFDLALKKCNGVIKGITHCLTPESKGRFLVKNVWLSMMSSNTSKVTFTESEKEAIFEEKVCWKKSGKFGKIVKRRDWTCCICGNTVPEREIFITVKGFYIQNRQFMSNIKVPPLTICTAPDNTITEEEKKTVLARGFTIEKLADWFYW